MTLIERLVPVASGMKFYDNTRLGVRPPWGAIFVFGANCAGRHGRGAALHAKLYYGAIPGQGSGLQGNSYGIPTKDGALRPLTLEGVAAHVEEFVKFTLRRPDFHFYVTAVGTGLAGFNHADIAPMFKGAERCWVPLAWKEHLLSS